MDGTKLHCFSKHPPLVLCRSLACGNLADCCKGKDCTPMDLHSSLLIAIIRSTYNNTMVSKFSDIAKAPTGKTLKKLWMRSKGSCWGIVHLEWSERYFSSSAVEDHCSFVVRGSFYDSNGITHVKAIRFF